MSSRALLIVLVTVLLGACTTTPENDPSPSPARVAESGAIPAAPVRWGGQIIDIENRKDHTEIEVLGYPLNTRGRPDTRHASIGRFIVRYDGFLEPTSYSPGRMVSVEGPIVERREAALGSTTYDYPVLRAEALRLHRRGSSGRVWPHLSIGVQIGF